MSNARWRPSTSAANVPQSAQDTSGAAQLQSMLERLKQRPSLLATQASYSNNLPKATSDLHEPCSQSLGYEVGANQHCSARCHSSTGVTRWLPGAAPGGSGRQNSATPHSAERRRSRYSDVSEPTDRPVLTDHCDPRRDHGPDATPPSDEAGRKADKPEARTNAASNKDDVGERGTDANSFRVDLGDQSAEQTASRGDTTVRRGDGGGRRVGAAPAAGRRGRQLAPAATSQSALSSSADSTAATSTSTALTPDTGTQTSLTAGSPVRQTPRPAAGPPAGSAARQFQARPRRESVPEQPPKQSALEKAVDGGSLKSKSGTIPPIVRKTLMDFDRVQKLKYAAETAMREKKVFMIHGGYPSIRLALKRRGWVEKKYLINRNESEDDIDVSRWPIDTDNTVTSIGLADVLSLKGSKNSMILTRLLKDHQPNLIWSAKREVIDYVNLERDQLVNHFPRAPFNTKVGLCALAQSLHWYSESMSADSFIPRAFRIGMAEEKQEFVEDFRLTACASLLVWFKERYELHGAAGVEDADGEVPYSVIPTALQQCQAYIATRQHEDIEPSAFNRALWPHQWDNFLTNVYKVVHRSKKLEKHRDENSTIVKVFYNRITQLLTELVKYRPQTLLDGWLNIWIVKPGSSSRGRGIILLRQLEDILALVDSATQREGKYVVQKYIERPMLIYNTKFDIRQWFLVTDWNPLTVWMYKQSYLRFCSQQFTLGDLKEAVHLCNNAIQARYRNGERHAALPTENMWDSSTFQQFLKSREAGHAWDQIIYPAMKSAIISLCLASQTELEPRKGCFELFGADFLLTEDYHPWLIEVNSSPAMGASTSVTAWLCAMCLEDVIRVIVDRRRDSHADVGEFECILQQPPVSSPRYLGIDLSVHGHRVKPSPGATPAAPAAPPAAASDSEPPPAPRKYGAVLELSGDSVPPAPLLSQLSPRGFGRWRRAARGAQAVHDSQLCRLHAVQRRLHGRSSSHCELCLQRRQAERQRSPPPARCALLMRQSEDEFRAELSVSRLLTPRRSSQHRELEALRLQLTSACCPGAPAASGPRVRTPRSARSTRSSRPRPAAAGDTVFERLYADGRRKSRPPPLAPDTPLTIPKIKVFCAKD
ncbi:Protein monoglycylase TTLL8 [Amphibalanus amphitrite]|uniref:Protein monoglycylase TTLL8 n=1 Tax=Amphibalanus amphitrite TaxID=1232801 RepID=A0A6A4VXP4_AMPAM|nr:Protein monoglycylase TTLL8 [Amphibalanus amphitrite]